MLDEPRFIATGALSGFIWHLTGLALGNTSIMMASKLWLQCIRGTVAER